MLCSRCIEIGGATSSSAPANALRNVGVPCNALRRNAMPREGQRPRNDRVNRTNDDRQAKRGSYIFYVSAAPKKNRNARFLGDSAPAHSADCRSCRSGVGSDEPILHYSLLIARTDDGRRRCRFERCGDTRWFQRLARASHGLLFGPSRKALPPEIVERLAIWSEIDTMLTYLKGDIATSLAAGGSAARAAANLVRLYPNLPGPMPERIREALARVGLVAG
jgi:hypothetical protein